MVDRYNIRHSLRCDENGESLPVDPAGHPEDWQLLRTDVLEKRWVMAEEMQKSCPYFAEIFHRHLLSVKGDGFSGQH